MACQRMDRTAVGGMVPSFQNHSAMVVRHNSVVVVGRRVDVAAEAVPLDLQQSSSSCPGCSSERTGSVAVHEVRTDLVVGGIQKDLVAYEPTPDAVERMDRRMEQVLQLSCSEGIQQAHACRQAEVGTDCAALLWRGNCIVSLMCILRKYIFKTYPGWPYGGCGG